jgi:septum site-determining protein MinC
MDLPDLFATETMAGLCVRQGRTADAAAIYRRLLAQCRDDPSRERLQKRLDELTTPAATGSGVSAAPAREAGPAVKSTIRLPRTIHNTVRSGQVVYAEGGDLVVLAPINSGAQVIADGNIHIYAPLRGRAVAGAHGCIEARIFCQRLEAELVGIDVAYLTEEGIPRQHFAKPAQVLIQGDRCVVMSLGYQG